MLILNDISFMQVMVKYRLIYHSKNYAFKETKFTWNKMCVQVEIFTRNKYALCLSNLFSWMICLVQPDQFKPQIEVLASLSSNWIR